MTDSGNSPVLGECVSRVSALDSGTFFECFARRGIPVILTDIVQAWPCFERWTIQYLTSNVGAKRFSITVTHDGGFGIFSSRVEDPDVADMLPFGEFLQLIARDPKGGSIYYLQQKSIVRCLPELEPDLGSLDIAGGAPIRDVNFWCGERPSRLPLHYDTFDNFLAQVRGAKRVRLFHPSQTPLLYAGQDGSSFASRVDPDAVDLAKHPRFARARPLAEVVLSEGELLFMPAFWWHYVVTESCYSISLNYWYHLVWGQPRPAFIRARELLDIGRANVDTLPSGQRELALLHARSNLED